MGILLVTALPDPHLSGNLITSCRFSVDNKPDYRNIKYVLSWYNFINDYDSPTATIRPRLSILTFTASSINLMVCIRFQVISRSSLTSSTLVSR